MTRNLPAHSDTPPSRIHATRPLLLQAQLQRRTRRHKQARETLTQAAKTLKAGTNRTIAQTWFELGALFDDRGGKTASAYAYRQAARATGLNQPATKRTSTTRT